MISFKKLSENDLEQVLEWRTSGHVTKYMYTDIEKNIDQQKRWFESISRDETQYYWIIQFKETPIGLISLNNYDHRHRKAALGYYIGNLEYSAIAGRVHPYLYNYAFFELGLNKLYAEVMEGNEGIMKMHLFYGFSHTATFKEHVYKYSQFYNVEYFELLSSTWKEERKKFHKFRADFALS